MNRKELNKTFKMVSKFKKKLSFPWILQKEYSALRVKQTTLNRHWFNVSCLSVSGIKMEKQGRST